MFKLLEFVLGSFLVTVFTVASMFFFALHHILAGGGLADCTWRASVQAWLDADGDGRRDLGELPLSHVEIHVDDISNQRLDISWPAITNREGKAQVFASIPGCEEITFEIRVDIPEGYRLTTKPRIAVQPEIGEILGNGHIYSFGFEADR